MHFGWLDWLLLSQVVVALSRAKCTRRCPLDDDFHCLEVVYLTRWLHRRQYRWVVVIQL